MKHIKWTRGNINICKNIGQHGESLLSSSIENGKVRIFIFCRCCGTLEEITPILINNSIKDYSEHGEDTAE